MISLKDACKKISDELGDIKIIKILDAGDFWVFYDEMHDVDGPMFVMGHLPFAVNKSDGALWGLPHPPSWTVQERAAMDTAKEIAIPAF